MSNNEQTTALATIGGNEFAILKSQTDIPALIAENVGTDGIEASDLDRIKMPSGGGLAWEIPSIDGVDVEKEFEGVIIFHKSGRAYWASSIDESGGGTPPDCSSDDGACGVGKPGGDCTACPFAQFGSDPKNGRGQACKQVKQLFILRAGSLLPVCLSLPPTSLKVARQFMLRLASSELPYFAVLVKFGLEKAKNGDSIEYSKVTMNVVDRLSPEQAKKFEQISHTLRPYLEKVQVGADDYVTAETTSQPAESAEETPVSV